MSKTIAGFPFWEAAFDGEGKPEDANAHVQIASDIASQKLSDLMIFSHGWNNDHTTAQILYDGFFQQVRKLLDNTQLKKQRVPSCGVLGVFWPSILWPDEVPPSTSVAGGAAAAQRGQSNATDPSPPLDDLRTVFGTDQDATLQELQQLLNKRGGANALKTFTEKLNGLIAAQTKKTGVEDSLEFNALQRPAASQEAFKLLAPDESSNTQGGAAGLSDELSKLWDGAKGALRVTTYWQMKNRAGVVGRSGLGPLIQQIAKLAPDLKIHLIGHSFGARLVSYALSGLGNLTSANSPVKSLLLLQGAFSHFTFADKLPFDATRSGDLHGMGSMVDGPMLASFSGFDLAVGRAYPLAAIVARDDAARAQSTVSRWGAMGSDGAQAVSAQALMLAQAGTKYSLKKGAWHNLDGNKVIKTGDGPSGAHSDIIHPETAWVALSAAGIA